MIKRFGPGIVLSLLLTLTLVLVSCNDVLRDPGPPPELETFHFNNLRNNDIFLVKINSGNLIVPAANTGYVYNFARSVIDPSVEIEGGGADFEGLDFLDFIFSSPDFFLNFENLPESERPLPPGHPDASDYSTRPAPIPDDLLYGPRSLGSPAASPPLRQVGDKKNFYVELHFRRGNWQLRPATLLAIGDHCLVWVIEGETVVSPEHAQRTALLFDIIYPVATSVFGYEYGGGPGGDGGRDGDPRVQILIYDIINEDRSAAAGGYFWGKDFSFFGVNGSNQAEIFYVHTTQVAIAGWMPHLLIHELQHMINYNQKNIRAGRGSQLWYNEMMSMMAEDLVVSIFGPLIEKNPGFPVTMEQINTYAPLRTGNAPAFFNSFHLEGITEWGLIGNSSYTNAYAFGSYLMRNFGGVNFLRTMSLNNTANEESVSAALNAFSPGMDFAKALYRYPEAYINRGNSPAPGIISFNRTVTSNNIGGSGISFTLPAINMWNYNTVIPAGRVWARWIFNLGPLAMRPNSFMIHSDNAWLNVSGDITIDVAKPRNENVEYYFVVR